MRYMLMMNAPRGNNGEYQITQWSPEDVKAHMAFMHDLNRDLTKSGELLGAEGLSAPGEAKLVKVGKNGEPVTDGPFPETKEFLVGYWMVDVDRPERAYEIAARASSAPGPGGVPLMLGIEVRQIMTIQAPDA